MALNEFKTNVEAAMHLLAQQPRAVKYASWLHENALAGMAEAGLENLPAGVGFQLGTAVARFRRIASEVAEAYGIAERDQFVEGAAALRTIADILKALPTN
jgi:hypothetical protein